MYATFWSLVPPVVAIVLALITKEVYSSLFVGIATAALFYAQFHVVDAYTTMFRDGFIASLSDSSHVGILIFLVVLGTIVVLMNRAGGSAAYGKWAQKRIKTRKGTLFATFALGVLIFVVIPLMDVFISSFRHAGQGGFAGLQNYRAVWSNTAFRLAAGNSLRFELVSVPLLMVISLIVAIEVYGMKSNIVRFAFLIPLAIPSNSLAVVWKILFADLLSGKAVFWLFVGTFIFKNTGYNMLIWMSGLSAIPETVYDAARVDGAGRFTQIFRITLPNMKRSFFIVAMLSVVNSLKIFREQYLMTGSYPDMSIYQIQHTFNNWFEKLEISKLTAGAVMTAVVFFGIILAIRALCLIDWHGISAKYNRKIFQRGRGGK